MVTIAEGRKIFADTSFAVEFLIRFVHNSLHYLSQIHRCQLIKGVGNWEPTITSSPRRAAQNIFVCSSTIALQPHPRLWKSSKVINI